jgi:hypothetical protein
MKIKLAWKWPVALASVVSLAATFAQASPKKKTQFDMFVPVAPQPIKTDRYCGNLAGALSSDDFFDGLVRIDGRHRVEFRKASQPVKEFPSQVAVALAGDITPCASSSDPNSRLSFVQPGNASSPQEVNQFINGLKFTAAWKNNYGFQPVQKFSVTKSAPGDKSWRVNDQIPWRFAFQVPSQGVPLTNQLVISVYAPSGAKLATFTAGVLSRIPKHHTKTLRGEESE